MSAQKKAIDQKQKPVLCCSIAVCVWCKMAFQLTHTAYVFIIRRCDVAEFDDDDGQHSLVWSQQIEPVTLNKSSIHPINRTPFHT